MNESIYFRTSLFDVTEEKENPINPIYGISLLEWLRAGLANELVITEPDAEDWGWYSELEYEGSNYLIGACALYEQGNDPAVELEWVFQVVKHRSFKEKLFGKNKMSTSDACFVFFKELFEKHPDIKEVQVG